MPHGLTLIGVEAVLTLRTEKGYIAIGIDTDGTTLPGDLGLAGAVGTKASDFIGRRSLSRPAAVRADRLQLVGLLSDGRRLPVGAHVVRSGGASAASDGHVTSSVDSPHVGRSIALAMVRSGRSRLGEEILLADMDERYRARIVEPCFFDIGGERLRG